MPLLSNCREEMPCFVTGQVLGSKFARLSIQFI
uniref:Uncharacterized protein n=1 Tax=Rhizophora mucronata TaxID=61149 RepID=A0A2P2QS95_RHIMU